MARVHGRFGLQAAVKLLHGEADPRLERAGLDRTPDVRQPARASGAGSCALLRRCVTAGWVELPGRERPVVRADRGRARGDEGRAAGAAAAAAADRARRAGGGEPVARESAAAPAASARGRPSSTAAASALFERPARPPARGGPRAQGVPPYIVASDRTLRDMAMLRPRTLGESMSAHGIGPAKAERYGAGFLDTVARALSPSA